MIERQSKRLNVNVRGSVICFNGPIVTRKYLWRLCAAMAEKQADHSSTIRGGRVLFDPLYGMSAVRPRLAMVLKYCGVPPVGE